jgi:IclR family acetate operon transcriptional repressor
MDRRVESSGAVVQSVDRALRLVEILARRQVAGVTELSAAIGVHKSTASRLLATLEAHGIVRQNPGRGSYRLGSHLIGLAGAVTGSARLYGASHGIAERLAHEVGETVNVAVLDGDIVVNVDQIIPGPMANSVDWTGRATPLHATSSGKVLLSWLAEGDLAKVLERPLERFTPATVVDAAALRHELVRVREQGWGITVEELEPGLNAVSAPIFDRDGMVAAALTVSGPAARLGSERLAHVAVLTSQRATEVSSGLGFVGRPALEPGGSAGQVGPDDGGGVLAEEEH